MTRISILDGAGGVVRTLTPAVPAGSYSLTSNGAIMLLYATVGSDFVAYLLDAEGRVMRQSDAVLSGITKLDANIGNGELLIADLGHDQRDRTCDLHHASQDD